jgi:hypothetical protein
LSDPEVCWTDPEVGLTDPEVGLSDPEVGLSDPEVCVDMLACEPQKQEQKQERKWLRPSALDYLAWSLSMLDDLGSLRSAATPSVYNIYIYIYIYIYIIFIYNTA